MECEYKETKLSDDLESLIKYWPEMRNNLKKQRTATSVPVGTVCFGSLAKKRSD